MKNEIKNIWTDKKRTLFGLPISFTRYFLTETKFIIRTGFLSLEETEFDLYKVTDKKLQLPLFQRIFGCGTIVIYVKDTDSPTTIIKCIKKPREVLELLDKHIDTERDKYRIRGKDIISALVVVVTMIVAMIPNYIFSGWLFATLFFEL